MTNLNVAQCFFDKSGYLLITPNYTQLSTFIEILSYHRAILIGIAYEKR